jgi:RNA-dependent RNA polymerase
VRIEASTNRLYRVPSPVNPTKTYHELNIFYANSIDIGMTVDEHAMSVMQTVETRSQVRMALSLGHRKELDFQFPCRIDGKVRNFRFRLPLSLVGIIYKVHDSAKEHCALIIPYETPPQFFMQKEAENINETCNPNDRTWIDWYSWYRQTDVVDGATRDHIKTIPVMTRKDGAIIDIG